MPLADVPGWVAHLYGLDDPDLLAWLSIAVRSPHLFLPSIPNVEPRYPDRQRLPSGLALSRDYGESRVYVADWDQATKECPPGFVNGWDGQRQPILVIWAHVERWLPQYRREVRERQRERNKSGADRPAAAMVESAARTATTAVPLSGQAVVKTIRAERRTVEWLTARMKACPDSPAPKSEVRAAAEADGLPRIADRAFNRAWVEAVRTSGAAAWSAGGRRKSPQ